MRKRLKMSIFRRATCVGLTAVMATTFVAGQVLAFADNGSSASGTASASGVSYENVTGKIDLTDIKLANMNPAVVQENDSTSADIPETCTVIVSLDGKSLSERAGGELVSEYITTDAGKDAVRAIESEQASFLASLKKAAISYELVGSYNAVMNGVALNVRTAQLTQIKALGGVSTVSVSQTYAVPQEEEGDSSSVAQTNYSNIYENGIYNSSDLVAEGYDGSGMTVAILDTGLDYTHEAFLNMPAEDEKDMIGELKAHLSAKNVEYTTIDINSSLQESNAYSIFSIPSTINFKPAYTAKRDRFSSIISNISSSLMF